ALPPRTAARSTIRRLIHWSSICERIFPNPEKFRRPIPATSPRRSPIPGVRDDKIMKGLLISFEGTEGCGKSTQISLLAKHLRFLGRAVRVLREPGGTPIGEEIRQTLKHSEANRAMTAEAELLLMNASRAQLVREVIRPALAAGEIVLCDRFYDSTVAYQGHGRGLDLKMVKAIIDVAVGETRPDLTVLMIVPHELTEQRRLVRQPTLPLHLQRDRIEGAGH